MRKVGAGLAFIGPAALAAWIAVALAVGGCGAAQSAAARDPMQCERDPTCAKARASYVDCTKQCVDDPECVDRCSEIQRTSDSLGH